MLLTEIEVAERLRCSTSKIKRLRLKGELPYLAGRPVLIEETDLHAFIEQRKRRAIPPAPTKNEATKASISVGDARAWALEQVLLKPTRRRKTR